MLHILLMLATAFAAQPGDWRTKPLVYGLSPYFLALGQPVKGLEAARRRLAELDDLGANIVWLQPIMPAAEPGHGYDVVDFTKISPDLGTERDLERLVRDAHARNMKVILDFVPNHSSDAHPFVKDVAEKGSASPYFAFYQHEPLKGVAFGEHQHVRRIGLAYFVYYFWENLLNFDYGNPRLRDYVFDTMESWIKRFDVDGFRLDASWAPASRYPGYDDELASRLRKRKADLILLKEAARAKLTSALDWTYDWDEEDRDWVSRWAFSLDPETSEDVFNAEDPADAAARAYDILSRPHRRRLRFLENNDTPGFLTSHSPEQADFALAVMLTLPGVPLVFHGQETGSTHAQFELPSFDPAQPLSARDPKIYARYKELLAKRLTRGEIRDLRRESPARIAFTRGPNKVRLDFEKKTVEVDGARWR